MKIIMLIVSSQTKIYRNLRLTGTGIFIILSGGILSIIGISLLTNVSAQNLGLPLLITISGFYLISGHFLGTYIKITPKNIQLKKFWLFGKTVNYNKYKSIIKVERKTRWNNLFMRLAIGLLTLGIIKIRSRKVDDGIKEIILQKNKEKSFQRNERITLKKYPKKATIMAYRALTNNI